MVKYDHSISLCLLAIHILIICFAANSADIDVYVGRLDADIYYDFAKIFTALQHLLSIFDDHQFEISALRIIIILIFFIAAIRSKSPLAFLFLLHPVVILTTHNSIRQGLALALMLAAFTVVRISFTKLLLFLSVVFSHISGIFGLAAVGIFTIIRYDKNKIRVLFLLFFGTLMFVSAINFVETILEAVGKQGYLRQEKFTGGRFNSTVKGLYFFVLAFAPIVLSRLGKYRVSDITRLIIFTSVGILISLNIATDGIMRIAYFLLLADFFYFLTKEPRPATRKILTFLHLSNPSGATLLWKIIG